MRQSPIKPNIKGKKCGLQWSSVKGKVKGVTRQERVAKFDCHDKGDRMVVDMAQKDIVVFNANIVYNESHYHGDSQ